MTTVKFQEYHDAGYKVFGLYDIDENGKCRCGDPECAAIFKHPRIPSWQTIPHWSDEQLAIQNSTMDHFRTGFGVLCDDLFVIDVDARNGGLDAFYELQDDLDIDLLGVCGFIVNTGSQDGSMHLYFKAPIPAIALQQEHAKYKGIDFKSSGYVVGLGSVHKSGNLYTLEKGSIDDLTDIPQCIIDILKKPATTRTKYEGKIIDVTDQELQNIVDHISNDSLDYNKWITVGMAVHDATNGSNAGFIIWDTWSINTSGDKHNSEEMPKRWDSFGGNTNKATIGTLYHYAKQDGGYTFPIKIDKIELPQNATALPSSINTDHIDIKRPHGFVGELVQMINDRCLYPRENLAVAAALLIMSATGGTRFVDESGITGNVILIGVAGSGSGKESIVSAITEILTKVGVHRAVHGKFKSDKEFLANLIEHQFSIYNIDEIGEELSRVANSKKRGGSPYLEAMMGSIMSVYSKATSTYLVSGDQKREMIGIIDNKIRAVNARIDKGEISEAKGEELIAELAQDRKEAENGIVEPFLTMFGATTPVSFDSIVTYETATNGLMARASIFKESETNPRRKEKFKPKPYCPNIINTLVSLFNGGNVDADDQHKKLKRKTDWVEIETTEEGMQALDLIYEHFYEEAENSKNDFNSGLEAIYRRGWEVTSKISLLMSLVTGIRTKEDVLFGFALAKNDIDIKVKMAKANMKEEVNEVVDATTSRVLSLLSKDEEVTLGSITNRIRVKGINKDHIAAIVEELKKKKVVTAEEREYGKGGRKAVFLKLV